MKCPFGSLIQLWHSLLIGGSVTRIQHQRFLGCINAHISDGCNGDCQYLRDSYLAGFNSIKEELPRQPSFCEGIV